MRVGKKQNVVEAKKTRSCVVRLEKVPAPKVPLRRTVGRAIATVGSGYKASPAQDEKTFKGPLKKRPVTSQVSTPVATPRAKEKDKAKPTPPPTPQQRKVTKPTRVAVEETPPPTIAAGRSRRAIKPNPKYASEDMVTPKSIKTIGTPATASATKKVAVGAKARKYSSSSEDFYNKDSSDDITDNELDEYVADDKAYNVTDSKDSDSDFDELVEEVSRTTTRRSVGRPKKSVNAVLPLEKSRTQLATPAPVPKTTLPVRSSQSQLQQLRKTLSASASRFAPTTPMATATDAASRKRKAESSHASDDEHFVARKRFMQGTAAAKYKMAIGVKSNLDPDPAKYKVAIGIASKPGPAAAKYKVAVGGVESKQLQLNSKTIISRNNLSSQTLNGSKIMKTPVSEKTTGPAIADKVVGKLNLKPTSATRTPQNPIMMNKAASTKGIATAKQRSSSPANPKGAAAAAAKAAAAKEAKNAAKEEESKPDESLNTTVDDFETMPTFTIVNINDIINKKGDVLISKAEKNAAAQGKAAGKSESPKAVSAVDKSSPPPSDSPPEAKTNRRKAVHTTILSEKIDPERLKNPTPRTPFPPKKPTQTVLNHTLSKKTPVASQRTTRASNMSNSTEKPAPPRILNSMVAKKTQPVKPMIANPDDSGDESFPLSLDGDEEDMDGDEDEEEDEEEDDEPSFVVSGKRKLPTSTPLAYNKKSTAPATKENSLAATNRMPATKLATAAAQRKLSPEKVVISRQGDKIIKKITCFETWYVINMPEERPTKVVRNELDIPLIKLANISQHIDLPSSSWSSKVTLFQLSATTVAKSTLITYTGDLSIHNIAEEDRSKYQPSCVMFRRAVNDRLKSRLPYDRAVIFKNKTFFTNIEGKNVKLVGAPTTIGTQEEVEILLEVVDGLTLESSFVEPATTVQ